MTWTDQQLAAYEKLEAALEDMIEAFGSFKDSEFLSGFIVAVSGIRPLVTTDRYEDDDDENASCSSSAYFYKRGQHPLLSRGIAHNLMERLSEG